MFTMIFACDTNGAIGKDGDLPWRQSSDLQHFKQVTMSKTIVMGRKTWDSLPKALPGRRNIVMSRTPREDVEVLDEHSLEITFNKALFSNLGADRCGLQAAPDNQAEGSNEARSVL